MSWNSLEVIFGFFARSDVCVAVFVALIILTVTYLYMMPAAKRNTGNEYAYKQNHPEKNEPDEMSFTRDVKSPSLKNEKDELPSDKDEFPSDKELDDVLLDSQDLEMIKKVGRLDTKDPSSVKHYVQEIRTMSYKGKNLSQSEKEKEEEAKQRQLSQIYALMNQEKEKFGETTFDDLKEQMSMYNH